MELPNRTSTYAEEVNNVKSAVAKGKARVSHIRAHYNWWQKLADFLPCIEWIATYDVKRDLVWDLLAGLSVGFMVVPQAMSYATLAGVPSAWGLYGSFVPILMYSVFGSSRQLAVGPVAVTSLLIGNAVRAIVPGAAFISDPNNLDSFQYVVQQRYNKVVTQLAFLVAILYTTVGALRLGFIVRFFSHPVITGYTSGAAITFAMSQAKYVLGYAGNIPRKDNLHEQIQVLIDIGSQFESQACIMLLAMLAFLISCIIISRRFPRRFFWLASLGPMIACIVGIIVVKVGHYDYWPGSPIRTVNYIPKGLPKPTIKDGLPLEYQSTIVPLAFVVMLVDMLESTSIARALARKNGYKLVYNREIVGLGVANFFGAAFNAYTTTGSFSRSAVNNASGARTQLAGVISAFLVMFVLLFLTPVFQLVPYNTIAAVIIAGCTTLFEGKTLVYLAKTSLRDLLAWLTAFFVVVFQGVEIGLAVSVGLSFAINILEMSFPRVQLLGRVPKTEDTFVDTEHYTAAEAAPGVLAVRFQAPLSFVQVQYVEDLVEEWVDAAKAKEALGGAPLEFLVLDLAACSYIDSSGCHTIGEELAGRLAPHAVQLVLVGANARVLRQLERSGALERVGRDWVFSNMADALNAIASTQLLAPDGGASGSGSGSASPGSGSAAGAVAGAAGVKSKDVDVLPIADVHSARD